MYNTIVTAGYLVSDPETRNVGDSKVCKMRMCVSDNKAKDPCFIDVEVWDRQAEVASEYLKKGRSIILNGELKSSSWEKDGKKFSKNYIRGNTFKFLNTGPSQSDGDAEAPKQKVSAAVDEDIPF
jgi:single-strand DNA-binding protein